MAKAKIQYVCQECGHTSAKWIGNCPSCGRWNTFKEITIEKDKGKSNRHKAKLDGSNEIPSPQSLDEIDFSDTSRIHTQIGELDRVLGGGFLEGSFVLLGGDPGVGKSTLTLQIARSNPQMEILYCSGEESATQIKQRARRIGVDSKNMQVYTDTDLSNIIKQARNLQPDLLIIDSIQTVYRTELSSMPGSIQQIRECAAMLQQLAKKRNITTMIIGHVTKEGSLAGPRVLEHMVDTVLQFEGDKNYAYRLLRTLKNRFGPAQEIGVFEMVGDGLREVKNPSQLFLSDYNKNISGNAVACTIEGSRPLLIEVQALVTPSNYGTPQRTTSGFDYKRLSLLLAVLEKRSGFHFSGQDVYLNVAGGIKLDDTAADLSVMCSLVSSFQDKPLKKDVVFLGEVGLGAEVRGVNDVRQRLGEMQKMGFNHAVLPSANRLKESTSDIEITYVKSLHEALEIAL